MRKLIYYVATSLDGFIAQNDGAFDGFVPEGEHVTDYLESFGRFDTVLMGRKTYDVGLKMGKTNPYPMFESYVFSRSMEESPDEQVTLVKENAMEIIGKLKKTESDKPIYLCGGGDLAAQCLSAGLIDELIVKLNPFLMGTGIPLFTRDISQTQLELIKSIAYSNNGVLFLYYRFKNASNG